MIVYLILHFVGDFILQSRYVGINKSKYVPILAWHCLVYVSVFIPFAGFTDQIVYLYLSHFITDYVTSRLSAYYYNKDSMYMFWNIIGCDQLLHIICIYLIFVS